jgi:hypothetical protein
VQVERKHRLERDADALRDAAQLGHEGRVEPLVRLDEHGERAHAHDVVCAPLDEARVACARESLARAVRKRRAELAAKALVLCEGRAVRACELGESGRRRPVHGGAGPRDDEAHGRRHRSAHSRDVRRNVGSNQTKLINVGRIVLINLKTSSKVRGLIFRRIRIA